MLFPSVVFVKDAANASAAAKLRGGVYNLYSAGLCYRATKFRCRLRFAVPNSAAGRIGKNPIQAYDNDIFSAFRARFGGLRRFPLTAGKFAAVSHGPAAHRRGIISRLTPGGWPATGRCRTGCG